MYYIKRHRTLNLGCPGAMQFTSLFLPDSPCSIFKLLLWGFSRMAPYQNNEGKELKKKIVDLIFSLLLVNLTTKINFKIENYESRIGIPVRGTLGIQS